MDQHVIKWLGGWVIKILFFLSWVIAANYYGYKSGHERGFDEGVRNTEYAKTFDSYCVNGAVMELQGKPYQIFCIPVTRENPNE